MQDDQLRITEIFYSIQGESSRAGRPCVFVRLARCNLRCSWCDTTYSFTGGALKSIDSIIEQVTDYRCSLVEVTGGEPLLQPGVHDLMQRLCDAGHEVLLETSGSLDISAVDDRVRVIMDLKAPGSGQVEKNYWENIAKLKPTDEVKFVLLDRVDFDWAIQTCREHELIARVDTVHFSPVYGELDAHQLAEWILEAHLAVRLNLQIHKFLEVE